MKTIALIPVKNEDWILEYTLRNMAPHVDFIIIADQGSTDSTLEICGKFSNVLVISNPHQGHSNMVRWLLLDAARNICGPETGLMICIDADEMIAPQGIERMKNMVHDGKAIPGDVFKFRWIQLWKSADRYMDEGAWKNSYKNIAFVDKPGHADRVSSGKANDMPNEYARDFVINDHTTRVPDSNINSEIPIDLPLLHFHFVAWKKSQLKQAWYRCTEHMAGKRNAKRINNTYRVTLMSPDVRTYPVPSSWIEGLQIPRSLEQVSSSWHLSEIMGFFDVKGISFFEELQIWHVPELHDEFVKRMKREPVSKTYPAWLSAVNEVKNSMRNWIVSKTAAYRSTKTNSEQRKRT